MYTLILSQKVGAEEKKIIPTMSVFTSLNRFFKIRGNDY